MRFRGWLYGLGMKSCGKNFQVAHDVNIKCLDGMSVETNCYVVNNNIILGSGTIVIESEVQIGPNCVLASGNHVSINGSYYNSCLLYTSPSPRDRQKSRMPSSA